MTLFFLIFICMCIPYFLYFLLFNILYKFCLTRELIKRITFKLGQEASLKFKVVSFFVLVVLASIGTRQIVQYYLFSGVYFWFVIFSGGLLLVVYLAPMGLCITPFLKLASNRRNRFKKFYFTFVTSFTFMWAIILLVDRDVKIYFDEGGVSYTTGSLMVKFLGGVSLFIMGIYGLLITSANYNISSEKNKTEESAWTIIGSTLVNSLVKKINDAKKHIFYDRNKTIITTLLPVIFLSISGLIYLFFNSVVMLSLVIMEIIPVTLSCFLLLCLRKVWLSKTIQLIMKNIGAFLLIISWLIVFLLVVLMETMTWETFTRSEVIYGLVGSGLLGTLGYSFIWTIMDLLKDNKLENL